MSYKKLLVLVAAMFLGIFLAFETRAEVFETPGNSSFKSYMDYKAITATNSKQYKLQTNCITNGEGLRTYNGYYTVAVGSGFGATVGDYIDVKLSTGALLHCIIGDMKQDGHTGSDNIQVTHNGNIVEFIVDITALNRKARMSGDISSIPGFEGDVVSVTVLGSANFEAVEEESVQLTTSFEPEYLILAKSSVPLVDGGVLYSVDYTFDGTFNNIICTENFYNNVNVGDVLSALE